VAQSSCLTGFVDASSCFVGLLLGIIEPLFGHSWFALGCCWPAIGSWQALGGACGPQYFAETTRFRDKYVFTKCGSFFVSLGVFSWLLSQSWLATECSCGFLARSWALLIRSRVALEHSWMVQPVWHLESEPAVKASKRSKPDS